jgi:translation elongation factor EF-Ts
VPADLLGVRPAGSPRKKCPSGHRSGEGHLRGEAAETGKPANICEKIAEGKLKKWFSDVCLLDQPFVKDTDKTINQLLVDLSSKVGEKISVRRFVRYQLGEGIEKKESNFAEEVAAELAKAARPPKASNPRGRAGIQTHSAQAER